MNLIGLDSSITSKIKEFDEQQFFDIVKFVNDLDVEEYDIYEALYKSKYSSFPSETEKRQLDDVLNNMKRVNPLLETEKKGSGYEWVYINRKEKGEETFRFYFGINPMNMYKVVEKLTEKFASKGLPVSFKYQQEGKRNSADRIILYTNYDYKDDVEKAINEVYLDNKELFNDSERALPWIYESKVPNVYFAPESLDHRKSYGERFASALMDSKKVFHYLYQEDKVKDCSQLEVLKKIVLSSMLRYGIFVNKDGKRVYTSEQGIVTFYDKGTNTLRNVIDEKNDNYYEVVYDSSFEGKKALLDNYYSVKTVKEQQGVKVRVLSRSERNKEIWNYLYSQANNGISR